MASYDDGHTRTGTMVYHVPFVLNQKATSASGIRPVKMRNAFEAIGLRVLEVSGPYPQRRKQIAQILKQAKSGLKIDFVYSEAATSPTGLSEGITPFTSLTRDMSFLRKLRGLGIPVGLFYRDIYWQFDEYLERVKQPLAGFLRWRYKADLKGYETAVDRIYLPSMRMASYLLPKNAAKCAALPPGATLVDSETPDLERGVSLFYVGGVGNYYRMHETVRGVEQAQAARLTICTREAEWREMRSSYEDVIGDSVTVVHRSGADLEPLYDDAHIGSLLMEPIAYRDFAAPLKLYEYLGHGKPVIATTGSLAGEFVQEHGFGWVLDYDAEALASLLNRIEADPGILSAATARAKQMRHSHTWEARAAEVHDDLCGLAR